MHVLLNDLLVNGKLYYNISVYIRRILENSSCFLVIYLKFSAATVQPKTTYVALKLLLFVNDLKAENYHQRGTFVG